MSPVLLRRAAALAAGVALAGATLVGAASAQPSPTQPSPTQPSPTQPSPAPGSGSATVDVISDVQGDLRDFADVLQDQNQLGLADALVVNGDLVSTGTDRNYEDFFATLRANPHPASTAFTIGNHEFYGGDTAENFVERFTRHTGMPRVYSERSVGGVPLVFIGSQQLEGDGHSVRMGAEQLAWLEKTLDKHRVGPVLLFSHHPLPETVSGTTGPDKARNYDTDYAEVDQLLSILGRHPNVVFFNGHTHWDLRRDDWVARRYVPGGHPAGFTAVNTGAVGLLYWPDGSGGEVGLDAGSRQALRVRVERGDVVVEARDHRTDQVIRSLSISSPLHSTLDTGTVVVDPESAARGGEVSASVRVRNVGRTVVAGPNKVRLQVPAGWGRSASALVPYLAPGKGFTLDARLQVPAGAAYGTHPITATVGHLFRTVRAENAVTVARSSIARGKPATQSSTGYGGVAGRAVDGNANGSWGAGSVTHTAEGRPQQWWQVDLGTAQAIEQVALWNRTDCCGDRLSAYHLMVSDQPFPEGPLADVLAAPGDWSTFHQDTAGTPTTIPVGRPGRYVRVQLTTDQPLSLAEVEVHAPDPVR